MASDKRQAARRVRYANDAEYRAKLLAKRTTPQYKVWLDSYKATARYKESRKNQRFKRREKINAYAQNYRVTPQYKAWWAIYRTTPHYRILMRSYRSIPEYRLRKATSERIRKSMRRFIETSDQSSKKAGSAVRDLGCSLIEFKAHIEAQFLPGMSWDNWTPAGWHLDHIRPLASFDLTNREQFLQACHYTNYQPLWASDNLRKGANYYP